LQTGGRGSKQFEPIYWADALDILTEKIKSVSDFARLSFLGGMMPDHLHFLVRRWLTALGAPPPLMFDLLSTLDGRLTTKQISEELFGVPEYPIYDIQRADVIFSFGANFLETWMTPVSYAHAFGDFRQGQLGGRGLFVQFESRLSATAASADEWVPIPPGTDGLVALAIGRIIVENRLIPFSRNESVLYEDVNVSEIANSVGIPMEGLQRLANILASADRPVLIPGGFPLSQKNGSNTFRAIQALNFILNRYGQAGGVYLSTPIPATAVASAGAPSSFDSLLSLVEQMQSGNVDILFIHGANPLFELPEAAGFKEAIQKVPFVVSFSPFIDETAVWSDLVLPDHAYLEAWGYQIPAPGTDRPVVSSQQPVVRPLYDTRSTGDVILALAEKLGGDAATAIPWADEVLFIEDTISRLYGSSLSAFGAQSAGAFSAGWQRNGGWWSEQELRQEPEPIGFPDSPLRPIPPTFEGDENEFPLHLIPYPNLGLSDGRGANLPWLQEMPDPMTTARWETWIEINPQTAQELGIEDNDVILATSQFGEISAVAVVFPGIRPDVVGIPIGQGHTEYGRYSKGRGSNPVDLLGTSMDEETGAFAWGTTRVRIRPTGEKYDLARLESLDGEGRETIR